MREPLLNLYRTRNASSEGLIDTVCRYYTAEPTTNYFNLN